VQGVLTVGDDELDVRHDTMTTHRRRLPRGGWETHMDGRSGKVGPGYRLAFLGTTGTKTCDNNTFVFIFKFYLLMLIQQYIYVT